MVLIRNRSENEKTIKSKRRAPRNMTIESMMDQDQRKRFGSVKKVGYVHIQVLRVREEDSYLGKDIGEGLSAVKEVNKVNGGGYAGYIENNDLEIRRVDVDLLLLSRPILPCSPLSGNKTSVN